MHDNKNKADKQSPLQSLALRRHSFRTSRTYVDATVFTRTRRTTLSLSGKVSVTIAFGQLPRLKSSSTIRTISPTRRLRKGCNHFGRCWSKYSLFQQEQVFSFPSLPELVGHPLNRSPGTSPLNFDQEGVQGFFVDNSFFCKQTQNPFHGFYHAFPKLHC